MGPEVVEGVGAGEKSYLERFEARQRRSLLAPLRFSLLIGAGLFLSFFVWEWTQAPALLAWTLPVRLVTSATLGLLYLASWSRLRRHPEVVLHAGLVVGMLAVVVLGARLPDGRTFTLGAVMLIVLFLGAMATSPRQVLVGGPLLWGLGNVGASELGWSARELFLLNLFLTPGLVASGVFAWLTWRAQLASFRLELALEAQAHRDALTGVLTRRAFTDLATGALGRRVGSAEPMAVLLLDVDHFKRINDTHGHLVGDAALRVLGAVLRRELREGDLVGRFGGEEFVVLLRGLEPLEAQAVAERLRAAIAAAPIEYQGARHAMTASLGLAVVTRREGLEAALGRADAALYAAKHAGRDRVRVASAPEQAGATGSSPGVARA